MAINSWSAHIHARRRCKLHGLEILRSTLIPMNVPAASTIGTLGDVQTMNAE